MFSDILKRDVISIRGYFPGVGKGPSPLAGRVCSAPGSRGELVRD